MITIQFTILFTWIAKDGIQRCIHTPNEVGYSVFDAVFTNAVIEVFSIQYTIHIT